MNKRNPENILRQFFLDHEESYEGMCAAYKALFKESTLWKNAGFPDCIGPAQAVELLDISRKMLGMETIRIDVHELAVADRMVATERVDHLIRADGSIIISIPVAGFTQFAEDEDRIISWREYADTSGLVALLGSSAA